ncbi:YwiB family protein [Ligilactobacillus equi]|uniref:DUF1934 domain-containing protein n=1 Tax=Ligilactobacillus equi DPC 6820 TaxID=1392007 RepID=V7HXR2_9LACO|nr:DUF1934 domain-containing protein [Ligilactobacillus equi]ETA73988.1 hypothetical protein LEQ_0645 [Ligilactobacillus equi DPC 6820]
MEVKSQKVRVHLRTKQVQDGQTTLFNQKFTGELTQKDDKYYLRYIEENENGQAQVILKISAAEVLLTRKQEQLRLQIQLSAGQTLAARYHTAFGKLDLQAQTQKLLIELDEVETKGVIKADYQLYSGQELLGDYKLRLHFTN